jgi:D-glycero-D-manno-heptose 1,7-bisphosphate phosphatase
MSTRLAEQGARIDGFYYCPFHADARVEAYRAADHPDRKPNPGMLLRAIDELSIDPGRSFLIGDQASDLTAAARAGIAGHLFGGGDLAGLAREAIAQLRLERG